MTRISPFPEKIRLATLCELYYLSPYVQEVAALPQWQQILVNSETIAIRSSGMLTGSQDTHLGTEYRTVLRSSFVFLPIEQQPRSERPREDRGRPQTIRLFSLPMT